MNNSENKFVANFRKFFVAYLWTFIISIVVGITVFLLLFFLGPNQISMIGALDGSTIAALALLGIGGLAFIANQGMFDSFSYGFGQLGSAIFAKKANKYNDYQGYLEKKRAIRASSPKYFMAILFASIPYLIATLILFIISKVVA